MGYTKLTLYPGMNMIGGLFQKVGTGAALSLNGQFADDVTVSKSGSGADNADTILTFDASSQGYESTYYFYYDEEDDEEYNNKWYSTSDNAEPTRDTLAGGAAGWYRYRGTSSVQITMAGEVPTNENYSVTLYLGMNFVANPYPCKIPLNGTAFSVEGITSGSGADNADTILTFDAATQNYADTYYFYYDEEDDEDYNNKWYSTSDNAEPTQDTIDPGAGFWYRHRGTGTATLTFAKPY